MEKFKVSFEANNQQLKAIGTKHASDTYADIEAEFVLGNRWTDMDSVSAVWWNDFTRVATVLDSQGKCIVPHEVLARKGCVRVNLVGSIVEGNELVTRLTSYSAEAVQVNEKIKLTGSETSELTPSQFEQFVTEVKADADRAETARDEAEAARDVAVSAKDTAVNAVEGFEDIVDTATATAVQTIQGEGATQVTAIQTEGTTQVASVRTEGSTQVTAVQDKGDEVLDSIPADYTQLSQNVTDLKSDLYKHLDYEDSSVSFTETTGKLIDKVDRQLIDTTTTYAVSDIIQVEPNETYLITASMNYGYYLYVFYDSSNNPFGGEQSATGSGITTLTDKEVRIPSGAVGLRIGYAKSKSYQHGVKKRSYEMVADLVSDALMEEIQEPSTIINGKLSNMGLVTTCGVNLLNPSTMMRGWALSDATGELFESASYIASDYMEVEVGKKYSAFALYNSNVIGLPVARVVAYKSDKTFLSYLGNIAYSATIPNTVTIPTNAKYVRVSFTTANYDGFGIPMFAETDGTAMPSAIVAYEERSGLTRSRAWINKKWTAVGDSLTEVNDKTTKNYCDYISEITGISVVNMGESGSGYMRKYDTNHAFYNRVANVPTDSDVVTIFGSLNDLGGGLTLGTIDDDVSDATVFGYVNGTIDALYTAYPTVNIGIISPTPWKSSQPWNPDNESSLYCEGLRQICYNRGIPFLDLYHCSNLRPWDATARDLFYSHDVVGGINAGCHPDENGHKMFAPKIKNFLESLML